MSATVCSHPHFIAAAVDRSHALNSPLVHVHAMDRRHVPRHDPVIAFREDDYLDLNDGMTVIHRGGYRPGGSVPHRENGVANGDARC